MAYSYPAMVAWNPGTNTVVKNTVFQVYAPTDTTFTTPLAITDNQGNALANLNSSSQGVFPSFQQAQYTTVVVSDTPAHTYAWTVPAALTNTVMQWAANTYYTAGQPVVNPSGDVVTANINHTTTSTYDSTKYNLSTTFAPTTVNGKGVVRQGDLVLNVKDYGAKGDGTTDDSSAVQSAFNAASTSHSTVAFPPGTYIIDNVGVPVNVKILGLGADPYRFGSTGVTLKHKASSTNPMLALNGAGVTLEHLTLDGNSATGDVLDVLQGFENRLRNVRIINGAGIGLKIAGCGNAVYENVHVDNCGSSTLAAVLISSSSQAINNLDFDTVLIERSANIALQIGQSSDTVYPEFLRFHKLHIEAVTDNGGALNSGPLVSIIQGRSIVFEDPFFYGGPGPFIQHNQASGGPATLGGVQVIGGTMLSQSPPNQAPRFVDLVAGNEFTITGTRLDGCQYGAVRAGTSYGAIVNVGSDVIYTVRTGGTFEDNRTAVPTPSQHASPFQLGAHLLSTGTAPTIAAGANNGTTPPAPTLNPSTDVKGQGFFGSGTAPAAGAQAVVTFNKAYANAPIVVLTAGNAATANLGLYVATTTTGFTVYSANAPAASQANGTYNFSWLCAG